jgi:hypothetical protein
MNIVRSLPVLIALLVPVGCAREANIPPDSFQLTVREIVSNPQVKVSVLDIRAGRDISISVAGEGFHSQIALPNESDGSQNEGEVVLSAARIAPGEDKEKAYIQTLIQPRAHGAVAGGPSVYSVTSDETLAGFVSITATSGTYKLDSPLTLGELADEPITLVVGKPTTPP